MVNLILKAILLFAIPVAVFLAGGKGMEKLVDRGSVTRLLEKANVDDRTPLNRRITGYKLAEVDRHWHALDPGARSIEQQFLEYDLVFPFLYGGALAAALLLAWIALGRPFQPVWLISPVAITVVADWIENIVQLSQLQLYAAKEGPGLEAGWIHVASVATVVKLVFFSTAFLLLLFLVSWMIVRAIHASS